jgi:protease-4
VPLVGMAAEYVFLGGFWEMLGIQFDVARAGKYKSAVEVYAERTMSDASREMANSLLDDTYARFVAALAGDRGKTPDEIRATIDRGLVETKDLVEAGLVDGEIHLDALLDRLGPEVVEHVDYLRTDPRDLGFDPQTRFALIYGSGTVVQGDAEGGPFATQPSFASESVSRAILEAAEDPDIAAIVLRIDSPGGSAPRLGAHLAGPRAREGRRASRSSPPSPTSPPRAATTSPRPPTRSSPTRGR